MISVILPSRNRAELLSSALGSLIGQSLPPSQFEILAIDNGSTDHTAAVVQRRTGTLRNLRYLYAAEPGLHAGRHRGMLEARGDVLVFADDDIEALPTWLLAVEAAFADPEVALVGGNNLPMFLESPPVWLNDLWEHSAYGGGRALGALSILELPEGVRTLDPMYVWGCNFAIRKEVLLQAGGFHPDGMPRDLIRFRGDGESHVSRWVAEQGLKCLFHSGASVYHKVTPERMTHAYLRQRGFNQGVSDSYTHLRRGQVGSETAKRSLIYRAARWGWRKLRGLAGGSKPNAVINEALEHLTAGHREGYAYHQRAYHSDPEVREWVHRERYF